MDLLQWIVLVVLVRESLGKDNFKGCLNESTYGYPYVKFFAVEHLSKTPPEGRGTTNFPLYYIEFYVKSRSNAHILMSESKTRGCEVLLGTKNNTESQIRFIRGRNKKTTGYRTEGILSDAEYRGFWVMYDNSGLVMVGRMNSSHPILSWHDWTPIKLKSVSFSTWTNIMGKWYFACSNASNPDKSDEVDDQNPTASLRLKTDLLTYYNPSNFPQNNQELTENVELHLEPSYLDLSEKCNQMEMGGMAYLKWKDLKLTWNLTRYDNVSVIYVSQGEIWTPTIYTTNSIDFEEKPLLSRWRSVTVTNDGTVTWRTNFRSVTYCVLGFKNWPFDTHECFLKFGFLTEPIGIDLKSTVLSKISGLKWELQVVNDTAIDRYHIMSIRFRRKDEPKIRIIMVPSFLSAAVLSLLSFVVNPNSLAKIVFNCLSLFILILTTFILADELPVNISPVPKIVIFYSWSIVVMCIPILLFISLRYMPPKIHLPPFLSELLNSSIARMLCFTSTTSDTKSPIDENANNSVRLCVLIERLVLVIYFTTLVVPFVIHFMILEKIPQNPTSL